MVSVTLSIPEEVKHDMDVFTEINWSGFIRKSIEQKVKELSWKETMLQKLEEEKPIVDWSLELQKRARKDRFTALKKKGLV